MKPRHAYRLLGLPLTDYLALPHAERKRRLTAVRKDTR